jgi:preprotein translocase subunit SecB
MDTQIRLNNIQVTDLVLEVKTFDKDITNNLTSKLTFGSGFTEKSETSFGIIFDISINDEKGDFNLKTKITAHFEANSPINDDFQNSSFVKISAPAIAFPYIRAFISNITLNSGYNPIMLPSFNFIKMAEEKENSDS